MRSKALTIGSSALRGAVALIALAASLAPARAERMPTPDDVSRIQTEQPLPSQEALDAVKGKNSSETAQTLGQARRQTQIGVAADGPRLPALGGTPEGIDVKALVEKHYGANRQTSAGNANDRTPGLLYFASLSVPETSLDRIIDQAVLSGAALVLRGLVKGGDLRATAERLGQLLKGREVAFLIDPTLFTRFDVRQVPAVVLVAGNGTARCADQACADPTPPHWAVAGDVSLDYALESIVRLAPEAGAAADPYLAKLRSTSHDGR